MLSRIAVVFTLIAVAFGAPTESVCVDTQALCHCQTKDGTIDLTPLSNTILNATTKMGDKIYSFNPCKEFSLDTGCEDVLGCQIDPSSTSGYNAIATQDSFTYVKKGNKYAIDYTAGNRSMTLDLTCDHSTEGALFVSGEITPMHYSLELKTKQVCFDVETSTAPSTSSESSTTTSGVTSTTTDYSNTTSSAPSTSSTSTNNPSNSTTDYPMSSTTSGSPTSTSDLSSTTSYSPSNFTSTMPHNGTTTYSTTTLKASSLSSFTFLTLCVVGLASRLLN